MEQQPPSPAPKIDARLSEKLVGVSFLAACFVVVLHAYANPLAAGGGATAWFVLFTGWTLPTFTVPIFFVISGYLLSVKAGNGAAEGWYGKAVKKRVRTLLGPYFLWCTLFAATVLPFTMLGNHLAGRALPTNTCLREPVLSAWNLARIYGGDLTSAPIDGALWYIRNLFLLVLAGPAILAVMSRRRWGALYLVASGALFFGHDWMPKACWQLFETGLSVRGFFFFPLGVFLAQHPVPPGAFRRTRAALPVLWLGACLLYVCLRIHGGEGWGAAKSLLARATNVLGVGAVWVLYDVVPAFRRLARLPVARDSFFVFACHLGILFTVMCDRSQQLLATRLHVPTAGIFLLRIAVPLGLSLALAEGMRRWFPRAYGWLTGGR